MKKLTLLYILILSVFLLSCGGGSNEKTEKEQSSEKIVSNEFSKEDGLITAKLPDGWTKDGKGPNSFSMYAYIENNTGDIHKDIIHDYGFDPIAEIEEIKVDNLPALTTKDKFMQNEEKISRTWLVYNGTDIICIVVQSNTADWDDNEAEKVISSIKINKRGENVKLPEPLDDAKYIRPESYPKKSIEEFNKSYSEKESLSVNKIEQGTKIYIALQELKEQNPDLSAEASLAILDSVVTANGLENSQVFFNLIKVSSSCITLLGTFVELDEVDNNDIGYKTLSNIISSMIGQVGISKTDIRFTYDNWEICKEFVKLYVSE